MYSVASVWSLSVKCIFPALRYKEVALRGLEAVREVAVWTEMSRELLVCKITMTRHLTVSLIKHNSRLLGPQTSPEHWVGTAGAEEHLYVRAPNRWLGGSRLVCVCVDVCIYYMCMSGCTWLSEEPISCSRLRRCHRAQRSRLFHFGSDTNWPALPESAQCISHLLSPCS